MKELGFKDGVKQFLTTAAAMALVLGSMTVVYAGPAVLLLYCERKNDEIRTRVAIEQAREQKYERDHNTLLDLADVDNDNYVNGSERADAWTRMDFKGPFIDDKFPEPTQGQLEKGIKSYERQRR